jgi:hypothetical protein
MNLRHCMCASSTVRHGILRKYVEFVTMVVQEPLISTPTQGMWGVISTAQ